MVGSTAPVRAAACVAVLTLSVLMTEGANFVVLAPQEGGDGAEYFPLAGALSSVTRLAVEHVEEAAAAAAPGGASTLSVNEVVEGIGAVADLCLALDRDEDTVAVRKGPGV